jgi:long-chain acyl-CoA synthetase
MDFIMRVLNRLKKFMFKAKDEFTTFEQIKNEFTEKGILFGANRLLPRAYKNFPDNIALIDIDKSITYGELYFRVLLFSKRLSDLGVKKSSKVIIYAENSIEFFIVYFAIWQLGGIVVPLNIFLHEKELAYIIQDAQPLIIFTLNKFKNKFDNLFSEGLLKSLPIMVTESDIDRTKRSTKPLKDDLPNDNLECFKPDDVCVLLYTSGTTGKPKGVMLSSKNVITNAIQSYTRFSMLGNLEKERFFCVLPLFHVFAQNTCLWLPVMVGVSVIIVQKIDRGLIRSGLDKKPTIFLGFPALYGLLCLMRTARFNSVKFFFSGADMLPDKIRSAFAMIYGRRICSGYGLTEASPIVALNCCIEEQEANVVGLPLVKVECNIRDDAEVSLGCNKIGTLWIRGDNVMVGYYNAPKATKSVLKNGWFNTGDLAYIDEQGVLAITGRSKDLIIHKGFNIYPQEIENILMMHPLVFRAAVVGCDEDSSGQIPVAYVAVKKIDVEIEKSLKKLCYGHLASYKVPRKFVCLEDLPMNATGKVDKKQLSNLH